jgi:4-carboxymuconolactone decarboxylase
VARALTFSRALVGSDDDKYKLGETSKVEDLTNDEKRAAALSMLEQFFSCKAMDDILEKSSKTSFAKEMGALTLDNVFSRLWIRPGLDRRSRSLLTLGILIALGSVEELKIHCIVALNNGLTIEELEEVIYHSTAYAGFPRTNSARLAIVESLVREGRIAENG